MKVILATGGSGGHIFPALKTAQRLKELGHEVLFVGALASAEARLKQAGLSYLMLRVEGLKRKSFIGFLAFGFLMIAATVRAVVLTLTVKPQVVAGFGSYSSFPVVLAAALCGVPVLVHEQNVVPGKANRLSFPLARRVAVSFQETKRFIRAREIVRTGCPCNTKKPLSARQDLLKKFGLREDRRTLLILGGSQGSRVLNEAVFETLPYLQGQDNIQVIHMTGRTDYSLYAGKYAKLDIPSHVCEFLENIEEAYSVADVVVARSGAGTVCEIAAFARPSILIPYPFAGGHQTANADVLQKAGVAVIIEQKNLSRSTLMEAFTKLDKEQVKPDFVHRRLADVLLDNPAERLAQAIVSLVK